MYFSHRHCSIYLCTSLTSFLYLCYFSHLISLSISFTSLPSSHYVSLLFLSLPSLYLSLLLLKLHLSIYVNFRQPLLSFNTRIYFSLHLMTVIVLTAPALPSPPCNFSQSSLVAFYTPNFSSSTSSFFKKKKKNSNPLFLISFTFSVSQLLLLLIFLSFQ